MPDYKAMYLDLFNSITKAVEILCDAQKKAEELYINSSEKNEHNDNQSASFVNTNAVKENHNFDTKLWFFCAKAQVAKTQFNT